MKKIAVILIVSILALVSLIGVGAIYISSNMNLVVSESMAPTLHRGDVVIVEKNPDNIQVGDIVVYDAVWFPQPIIHRVIAIKNDSKGNILYQMKGDNLPVPDPELVSKNQITSKVVNIIPEIGHTALQIRGL
ncbi:signal peptidase I [Methanobacterium sp. ACI-7]|uniref:signal peptidase I n=1 Tax=unclassified Methanobacterium TaxID=2627676 RepID=UPI0039C149D9